MGPCSRCFGEGLCALRVGHGSVTRINFRWGFWDPGPSCVLLLPGWHVENKCILDSLVYSCHDVFTALAQPQSNMANQPLRGTSGAGSRNKPSLAIYLRYSSQERKSVSTPSMLLKGRRTTRWPESQTTSR